MQARVTRRATGSESPSVEDTRDCSAHRCKTVARCCRAPPETDHCAVAGVRPVVTGRSVKRLRRLVSVRERAGPCRLHSWRLPRVAPFPPRRRRRSRAQELFCSKSQCKGDVGSGPISNHQSRNARSLRRPRRGVSWRHSRSARAPSWACGRSPDGLPVDVRRRARPSSKRWGLLISTHPPRRAACLDDAGTANYANGYSEAARRSRKASRSTIRAARNEVDAALTGRHQMLST